jgi:bifunctional DNase/RNase
VIVSHPHRTLPVLLLALLVGGGAACGRDAREGDAEIRVDVSDVIRDAGGNPVILLDERDGNRTLPIWIGLSEARSIAARLERIEPPRPNTHDLAKSLLDGLGARVDRVLVTELRDRTYYGLIVVAGPAGPLEVDSRPSDAIALALRLDAPIFVREGLFEEAGLEDERDAPGGQEVLRRIPEDAEAI